MTTIFNNLNEFADFYGSKPDEESLSRMIYKGTQCGAWLKVFTTAEVATKERWAALLAPEGDHVRVDSVKPIKSILDIDNHRDWLTLKDAPEEVKVFLSLEGDSNIVQGISGGWKGLEEQVEYIKNSELNKDMKIRLHLTQLSFYVNIKKTVEKPGIEVGSIVEGSDADCTPFTLYFPFTEQDFDDHIADLETEANEIWHEWNDDSEDPID